MTKKLSKIFVLSILLTMCSLFVVVFSGCENLSRLTNSWAGETKEFTVGQTVESALATLEVKYDGNTINIFHKDNNVHIILNTSTPTEAGEVRTCTITYNGQSTSFKYTVRAS